MAEIIVLAILLSVLAVYFLPAIVAHERRHVNFAAILVLNLLLGWTFIGWVLALVWAVTVTEGNAGAPAPVSPALPAAPIDPVAEDAQRKRVAWIVTAAVIVGVLLYVVSHIAPR